MGGDEKRAAVRRMVAGDMTVPFGQRIPTAADIEALAALVEADCQQHVLSADTRRKIDGVAATYCKQFKNLDNV